VFSQEQYAEISKNPAPSEREGHSSTVSSDAMYSYSRHDTSGKSGESRSGVGDDSSPSHKKHSWGTLGQPHHAADFRKSSHISVSSGTSKKLLSLHFLFVVGISLFGKPTASPSGQREHPPCLAVSLSSFTPLTYGTLSVSMMGRRRIIDCLVMISCIDSFMLSKQIL
jgi:hypothetical protein